MIAFGNGYYQVFSGDYVNKRVETENRATMLSINNMFTDVGEFLMFLLFGIVVGAYSLFFGIAMLLIFLVIGVLLMLFFELNTK